jgi:hypothetical protein
MSLALGTRSTAPARNGSVLSVLLLAVLVALAQVAAIDRVWQECALSGQVDFARGQLIAVSLPALIFTNALLIGLPPAVYGSKSGNPLGRASVIALAVLVLLSAESLLLATYVATPSPQTATVCVGNTPSWWPAWLPS